jgi:archaemetzincin
MQNLYLVPVSFSNTTLLKRIFFSLRDIFPDKVYLSELDINIDSSFSPERNQYFSTKIIADAIPLTEKLDGKVIILVEFDLYVPVFTFVFGEAQLNGKISIVSLCRLHEEFYNGSTDDELLHKRALKEILHELGHNYGLLHCREWDCVMHSSSIIEQVDIKGSYFCHQCLENAPQLVYPIRSDSAPSI